MAKRASYYDGVEGRTMRSFVRQTVVDQLKAILAEANVTGVPVYRSLASASNAFQKGQPFVVAAIQPTVTTRRRVLGHDDQKAHSGEQYDFKFLVQASSGAIGNKTTGEQTVLSDDELIDTVRCGLEERYASFRDDLLFTNLQVRQDDSGKENPAALNPLAVTFYTVRRLETDSFITVT